MIENGFQISIVGMSVVFTFLLCLIFLISLSSKILAPYSIAEKKKVEALKNKNRNKNSNNKNLVAIITAAIHSYRNK